MCVTLEERCLGFSSYLTENLVSIILTKSCLHYSNQPQKYGCLRGKGFVLKSEGNWHLSTSISKIATCEIPRKSVRWESNSQNHPKTCQYTVCLRNSALSSPTPIHAKQCSVAVTHRLAVFHL